MENYETSANQVGIRCVRHVEACIHEIGMNERRNPFVVLRDEDSECRLVTAHGARGFWFGNFQRRAAMHRTATRRGRRGVSVSKVDQRWMAGCKTRPLLSHGIVTLGWPLVDIMVTNAGNFFFKANGLLLDTVKMFVEREGNRVQLMVTPDAGKYAASADAGSPFCVVPVSE